MRIVDIRVGREAWTADNGVHIGTVRGTRGNMVEIETPDPEIVLKWSSDITQTEPCDPIPDGSPRP